MGIVMISCPETERAISTGIEVECDQLHPGVLDRAGKAVSFGIARDCLVEGPPELNCAESRVRCCGRERKGGCTG